MSRASAPVIKESGLARHLGESISILRKSEESQGGVLVEYSKDSETPYAIRTGDGTLVPLLRSRTRVILDPSEKALAVGRTSKFIYSYYAGF